MRIKIETECEVSQHIRSIILREFTDAPSRWEAVVFTDFHYPLTKTTAHYEAKVIIEPNWTVEQIFVNAREWLLQEKRGLLARDDTNLLSMPYTNKP